MTLENKTPAEESLIDELRCRMKEQMRQELYEDDLFFIRFIRARNHDIDAAESMLRNHMNFRKKYKVDTLLTDYIPHEFFSTQYWPVTKLGNDFDGSPVTYARLGDMDTKGILKAVAYNDILHFAVGVLERDRADMKRTSETTGKLVDKGVYIFDFENFSLTTATHKPTLEVLFNLLIRYEANYPETLKVAYIINASYYFNLLWTLLKPFISGPTQRKIQMFGKTGWVEALLQQMSPDILPGFLGGNRTDPDGDPMCRELVPLGGPVPESMFTFKNQTIAARLPGSTKLTINRMSKAEVTYEVLTSGSTLEWEFAVKQRDIGFAVLWSEQLNCEVQEVIPSQRIEVMEGTECGMYQCEKPGIYIIEFDNSYSWLHRKDIYYKVSVKPPRNCTLEQ